MGLFWKENKFCLITKEIGYLSAYKDVNVPLQKYCKFVNHAVLWNGVFSSKTIQKSYIHLTKWI